MTGVYNYLHCNRVCEHFHLTSHSWWYLLWRRKAFVGSNNSYYLSESSFVLVVFLGVPVGGPNIDGRRTVGHLTTGPHQNTGHDDVSVRDFTSDRLYWNSRPPWVDWESRKGGWEGWHRSHVVRCSFHLCCTRFHPYWIKGLVTFENGFTWSTTPTTIK